MLLALVLVALAVCVSGQVITTPATTPNPNEAVVVIGKEASAASGLKKPIVFNPPALAAAAADEPLTGPVPANLTKSAISENIYGGNVEWEKVIDVNGCRCRRQIPEKYRYDARFRRELPPVTTNACGCAVKAPNPEDALPPIIAKLRREIPVVNVTAPCPNVPVPPPVVKIAPSYYRRTIEEVAALNAPKAPCNTTATPPVVEKIAPKFYPTRAERWARKKARRARRAAAAAAAKKL
jgi:hypothetical protein